MAVEHDRLDLGQQRVAAVDVAPADLHETDSGILEAAEGLLEEVLGHDEVGVEDDDELTGRGLQPFVEGARLVAGAIGAVKVVDVEALALIALDEAPRERNRLVRRVVEDLDLEQVLRIADPADRFEQPLDDVELVEDGKLDGDPGKNLGQRKRTGALVAVPEVEVHHHVTVETQDGKDDEGEEVEAEDPGFQWTHDFAGTAPPRDPTLYGSPTLDTVANRKGTSPVRVLSGTGCAGANSSF